MVVNAKSKPLKGSFGTQEGLNEVLRGTGLAYLLMGDNSVTLEKVAVAEPQSSQTMPVVNVVGKTIPGGEDPYYAVYNAAIASGGRRKVYRTAYVYTYFGYF